MNNSRAFITGLLALAAVLAGCAREVTPVVAKSGTVGTVQSRDGVSIIYESAGSGDVTVALIHCWACNRTFWKHQVQPLVEAGYRVVTFDLPGHGQSGATRQVWTHDLLAADIVDVISELDLQQVVLVGHAMGGHLALNAAARMPERVIGVGCVAGLYNAEYQWPPGTAGLLAASISVDFRRGLESYLRQFLAPETRPLLLPWLLDQGEASDHTAVLDLMADSPFVDLQALFSDAGVPIRCINTVPGERRSRATEIAINRKYADFDAVLLHDVGLYPQLEQPEMFTLVLLDMLAELFGRGK